MATTVNDHMAMMREAKAQKEEAARLEAERADIEEAVASGKMWRANPKQAKFLTATEDHVLYGGAAGGGKTDALLVFLISHIMEYPGCKGLYLRRTFADMSEPEAAIDRSHKLLHGRGCQWRGDLHRWDFPKEGRLQFSHMQREEAVYNFQGAQPPVLAWDELTQFTEFQYDFLSTRVRSTIPGLKPAIRAGTNPGGVGHGWVKRRFVSPAPPNTPFLKTLKNGHTISYRFVPALVWDNEELLKIDPGYPDRLEANPNEALRRAYLEGDWNIFEGQYFGDWRDGQHTCRPIEIPDHWTQRVVGIDYGIGAPFCALFFVRDHDAWNQHRIHRWYCYRELYGPGHKAVDQAKMVRAAVEYDWQMSKKATFQIVADPSMWNKSPDGHSVAEVYAKNGVPLGKANNDRVQGWQVMRDYLTLQQDAKPAVIYFDTCRDSIRTLPDLVFDKVRVEDLDTDGEDHAADAARYAFMFMGPISIGEQRRGTAGLLHAGMPHNTDNPISEWLKRRAEKRKPMKRPLLAAGMARR